MQTHFARYEEYRKAQGGLKSMFIKIKFKVYADDQGTALINFPELYKGSDGALSALRQ